MVLLEIGLFTFDSFFIVLGFTIGFDPGLTQTCHSFLIGVFSAGWFTRKFLAQVALPVGAVSSPTGFTNDLPPLRSPTPETPRLTSF